VAKKKKNKVGKHWCNEIINQNREKWISEQHIIEFIVNWKSWYPH